ncbi:alpha/beta hydrolase [Lysobacter arenosi]|uniref:Alpha/beta hydrolase n=1 Tax=Lysobacter arenosi TaxID=2795387 RepID=A0ABX7RIL6_9GAMM|nr:alpha/beta hydrolase [Lysobacter arenosi]
MSSTFKAVLLAVMTMAATVAHAGEAQVQLQGYVLQAEQTGNGPMDIVFESGFGQGAGVWKAVIADLGEQCHCIAYARAGLGKSGTDGKPKTIQAHVDDLGAVIDSLAPGRKVVLVGHSYGGLLATEFARQHPERIAGLVLVDPATMSQRHAYIAADRDRVLADDKALMGMLPAAMGADYQMLIKQLDSPDAASTRAMPDVPVALLTSTQVAADPMVFEETAHGKAIWKAQHGVLFASFSRGTHRYLATGHNIHREDPKAVVDAIRAVAPSSRPAN